MPPVKVFISYAWEDDEYRFWVQRLATTLRRDGVDARLDAWHRQTGQDFPSFMNAETRNADRVLVLASPQYRAKVHAFEEGSIASGVGWEAMLLTAHVFAGDRGKIAIAVGRGSRNQALPDFLLTQPSHDLSLPDDPSGYRGLLKDLRGELPAAPPIGLPQVSNSETVTPLFERPPRMELTLELRSWLDARWPEGNPGAIYPSRSEFEAENVAFPDEVTTPVWLSLEGSCRALVVGRSASGKSVLAASIAFKWSRVTGRRAFWVDVADLAGQSPDALRNDVETFLSLGGANLLVLDNAQVWPAIADWAVTRLENAGRSSAGQNRLLILSRPAEASVHHQAHLEERLASVTTILTPSAAIFAAVAARLLSRLGHTPTWSTTDYEEWVHEFGGDLICFGQALLAAGKTGRPARRSAAKRVREAYIDPARRHAAGIAVLDRLCAAAILDLSVDDSALDGAVQQAVPHLIAGGHVQTLDKGPYRHWKFAHPGMGSLILETRARDTGSAEADLRRAALLDLVRSNPHMLGPVTMRVVNPTYGDPVELANWSRVLLTQPTVLEAFLCRAPTWAGRVDREIPRLIPWKVLAENSPQLRVLDTCRRTPPHFVVTFLRYAEHHEAEAARVLLRALLQDAEFRALLGHTSPGDVVTFLRYAEHREAAAARVLLRALLQDAEFRALLGRTPPQFVVTFLRYAEHHEADAVRVLLRALLQDAEFRALLGHTSPGDVVTFLRYAEHHEADAVRVLLRALLQDAEFRALLGRTPPHFVVTFLRYAERHEADAARVLLRALLQDAEFRALLGRAPPHFVVTFLRYAEHHEAEAARVLLRALLQDAEFRALLGHTSPGDVVTFLRYAEHREAEAARILLRALLQDAEFRALLGRTPPEQAAYFLEYVEVRESGTMKTLLVALLEAPDFARTAAACPVGHLAKLGLFALDRVPREASTWLCAVLALPGARHTIREATPMDLTALLRAVRLTSAESAEGLASGLLRDWWAAFRSDQCPDGNSLVACGPILRLADELAPDVADELVTWLNSLDEQFVVAMQPLPLVPRLGLALALRDTERWLAPPLWKALSQPD